MTKLKQHLEMPKTPKPVVIFGAGSIVKDAHLPAYQRLGVPVRGIYDPDIARAKALAEAFDVDVFETLEDAFSGGTDVIYDLATPPQAHLGLLEVMPENAVAILQKPMGSDLAEATKIVECCEARNIQAAVNFQLRYAPMTLALKDAIAQGLLGDLVDFDAWIALDTPWHLFDFLKDLPRVEILLHSIHYLDFVRAFFGEPDGIHAKTMGHPTSAISNTRTAMILDYADRARCTLSINHNHSFGRKFQACEFRICGTKGAAYMKLGVNLDYPRGEADELWLNTDGEWQDVALEGNWFIEAFLGRFTQLQRFATGLDSTLEGSVFDAWHTMALVEAAYKSSATPATSIPTRS